MILSSQMPMLLRCPKCGHDQKYLPSKPGLVGKSRKCVYCGRSFKVSTHIVSSKGAL